jgi:hypothetical protein
MQTYIQRTMPLVTKPIVYELGIETTKLISGMQDTLRGIIWTDGEANIDTEYSDLACKCCTSAWETIQERYPLYNQTSISCVKPDINITFTYPGGTTLKEKIELKSSKSKKMPGSTIQKLDINQTLIYCLRPSAPSELYKLRCSQYYSAMGGSETDLFQDRTPRPVINFDRMNDVDDIAPFSEKDKGDWVRYYAECGLHRIDGTTVCQPSWQDDMVKIMKEKIIEDYVSCTSEQQFRIDKASLFK